MLDDVDVAVLGTVDTSSVVEGRVVVEAGATVSHSLIRGPAIIGRNSVVVNSYVGPYTSMGQNVRIENSEIENSVVMDNVEITDIAKRIDNSLIGKRAVIGATGTRPTTLRFVLGDHSQVTMN